SRIGASQFGLRSRSNSWRDRESPERCEKSAFVSLDEFAASAHVANEVPIDFFGRRYAESRPVQGDVLFEDHAALGARSYLLCPLSCGKVGRRSAVQGNCVAVCDGLSAGSGGVGGWESGVSGFSRAIASQEFGFV